METFALFPTPVLVVDLPDMDAANRELTERLLEEEKTTASWQRANVGGWHSVPDLSQRRLPCFRNLVQAIVNQVALVVAGFVEELGGDKPALHYGVQAWAMVMRAGHYVTPHDHGDAHWSTAYYVDAGDAAPAPSGHLAFLDPRGSVRAMPNVDLFPSTFTIKPRTGALVIFPGWLQHYVHSYQGTRPRISISANFTVEAGGRPPR